MSATTTEVPWYYHSAELERYREDTKNHEMEILLDQGLYRHLMFRQPEHSWLYWHEIITTPGQLTIRGDMGCYVFARVDDMFEFFDGSYINPSYWGEKLQAHSGYREYSEQEFVKHVNEHVDECVEGWGRGKADSLRNAVAADVLEYAAYEPEAREALADFEHDGFRFADTWEWDFHDYTVQYLWCCHAIQQGIRRYREAAS